MGLSAPAWRSDLRPAARWRRDSASAAAPVNVSFTVSPLVRGVCHGGDRGLDSTSLRLDFRSAATNWLWCEGAGNISIDAGDVEVRVRAGSRSVEYRVVQEEHGGGVCHCWDLMNVTVNGSVISDSNDRSQCGGSASVPRVLSWNCSDGEELCRFQDLVADDMQKSIPFNTTCSGTAPRLNVEFQLYLPINSQCNNTINEFDEGVEFSIRLGTNEEWVPVVLNIQENDSQNQIPIGVGNFTNLRIRGYHVSLQTVTVAERNPPFSVEICDFGSEVNSVQFRWLQTSSYRGLPLLKDVWLLEHVVITYFSEIRDRVELLRDAFDGTELNETNWSSQDLRNGNFSSRCAVNGTTALVFGLESMGIITDTPNVVSRSVKTNQLSLTVIPTTDDQTTTTNVPTDVPTAATTDAITTDATTTDATTTDATTTDATMTDATMTEVTAAADATDDMTTDARTIIIPAPTSSADSAESTASPSDNPSPQAAKLSDLEARILSIIMNDVELKAIFTMPPETAIVAFQNLSVNRDIEELVAIYLLGSILNRTTESNVTLSTEATVGVASTIIETSQRTDRKRIFDEPNVEGSSLLAIMDNFIFNHFGATGRFAMGNIGLQSRNFSKGNFLNRSSFLEAIDSEEFELFSARLPRPPPRVLLQLPPELIQRFQNGSVGFPLRSRRPRIGSFLYENADELFPRSLPGGSGTELGSGLVSTALQCETSRCPTRNLELEQPVRITITHSDNVRERLEQDKNSSTLCVFLEFTSDKSGGSILSTGEWSEDGCSRNENMSNTSITVCECTHLTHFAILLSAAPLQPPQPVTLSLQIIGYVGVAISLVAMALTVFTFIAFRSLHNMRNYIHINLCISLGTAQLTFVAGVDQSASDHVPIHCQVVAVLLHYLFLVSFMWMLMEGVVLYVALVRVFVKKKKLYLLAFTVTSYGAPVLYLGAVTLPLGFVLPTQPNYGYTAACFLNPETKFIWAFIAPVLVIIVINTGFFIMAATIMWRHQSKQRDQSRMKTMRNRLKSAMSLVVIMGLTWIFGVLIVEVEELLALAYIYTILVAFQGVWIFIIFVPLSQQVREAYTKWWRVKVSESDFLSKHFGEKLTSSTTKSFVRQTPSTQKVALLSVTATNSVPMETFSSENSPKPPHKNSAPNGSVPASGKQSLSNGATSRSTPVESMTETKSDITDNLESSPTDEKFAIEYSTMTS